METAEAPVEAQNLTMQAQEDAVKRAMRYAVTQSPGFAAIALWCPWKIDNKADCIACTNGKTIRFGQRFFTDYTPLEQSSILVHEILHVALRHIPRMKKGRFDNFVWNIATDALINETIGNMHWLKLPDDGVRLDKLLTAKELHETPPHQWTSESLYAYLLKDKPRLLGLLAEFCGDLILVPDEDGIFGVDDLPLEEKIWKERLTRAQAGDRAGGLMREISHDFPEDKVEWEKVLRRLMTQPLLPQTKPNWNRPSRRTLALDGDYWEPGNRPRDGLPIAGVIVDTSGSIGDKLLTRFAAEIQAIQRRVGCHIYLICADADVQSETLIRNDGKSFKDKVMQGKIEFKGGGGTDFYPALQRMKEKKARVCVYLTDLYGSFGDETYYPFPIIWASVTKELAAPFGKTVYIGED